jgi:hypothetical protein
MKDVSRVVLFLFALSFFLPALRIDLDSDGKNVRYEQGYSVAVYSFSALQCLVDISNWELSDTPLCVFLASFSLCNLLIPLGLYSLTHHREKMLKWLKYPFIYFSGTVWLIPALLSPQVAVSFGYYLWSFCLVVTTFLCASTSVQGKVADLLCEK